MTRTIAALAVWLTIAGCSSPQPTSKGAENSPAKVEPKKEAERLTGRSAYQKLYLAARNWSPDAQPLRLESMPRSDDKHDGRASVWSARFASAQRGLLRTFTWSGAVGEGAPEPGISPGSQDTYVAGNASTQPFDPMYLQADSDKALETADKRAPASVKKVKDKPVKFVLYNDATKGRLLWRVIYGGAEHSAPAIVDISARDGGFVMVER
jgi:hypothetical protein